MACRNTFLFWFGIWPSDPAGFACVMPDVPSSSVVSGISDQQHRPWGLCLEDLVGMSSCVPWGCEEVSVVRCNPFVGHEILEQRTGEKGHWVRAFLQVDSICPRKIWKLNIKQLTFVNMAVNSCNPKDHILGKLPIEGDVADYFKMIAENMSF